MRAAYQAQPDDVGTSLVSVYNKLNGLETQTSAELVRYSAREFAPLIEHMGGERAPWLKGYRVKIVDGNCIEASEHRIKELRQAKGPVHSSLSTPDCSLSHIDHRLGRAGVGVGCRHYNSG